MNRPRASRAVLVVAAALLCAPAKTHAGTYYVRACHTDTVNAAWTPEASPGMTAYAECSPHSGTGLTARHVVNDPPVGGFSYARWFVNSPPGTYFDAISFTGQITGVYNWHAGLFDRAAGRWIWCGANCGSVPVWYPFIVSGFAATSLESLVICAASQCARAGGLQGSMYMRDVTLRVQDTWNPAVSIVGGSLATDGWKRGLETVEVAGSDNAGVQQVRAVAAGGPGNSRSFSCDDHRLVPCPSSVREPISVDVGRLPDGAHTLVVEAVDASGNTSGVHRQILVDNTAPDPPEQLSTTTPGWRSGNAFHVAWTNPPERGRAPIAGVAYQLCPASNGSATACGAQKQVMQAGVSSLQNITVPAPGAWRLRLWLIDAAGNQNPQTSRETVMQWDAEVPSIKLMPRSTDDPARIAVKAFDAVSGLASSEIEIRREHDPAWHSLPVEATSDGFSAVIDDERFPAGTYAVRARVRDHAGNEKSAEGPSIQLPIRLTTRLAVGKPKQRGADRAGSKRGRPVLLRRPRVAYGRAIKLAGRLTSPGGNPLADRDVEISERLKLPGSDWRPVATVRTDPFGRFRFKARPGPSRHLRFRFAGTPTIQGHTRIVDLRVGATSGLRVSRRRVVNGEDVTFRGRVRGTPIPATGKLLQLQVYSRGGWLTFATPRANQRGLWSHPYRFTATRGLTRYRFRVRVPREAGYPYETGVSRTVRVVVRGQ